MKVENYLNKEGKIKVWPSKKEPQRAVVRHLGSRFDTGRFYTEKEINRIVDENHAFGDYFLLRREMVEHGVMRRTPDGARYWRGGLWAGTKAAETERLSIREAEPEDSAGIGDIYYACGYMAEWTGQPHDAAGLAALLQNNDLPPGGSSEFCHTAVMRTKADGKLVGVANYYTAWPGANQIWIGLMLIRPDCQKLGYGGEFVRAFAAESRNQSYRQVGLGVALRNQPAMKFWVKQGFNRIDRVVADGETSVGSMGVLGLKMELA